MKREYCEFCGNHIGNILKENSDKRVCLKCRTKIFNRFIVGSGGIIEHEDKILLVKRRHEPFMNKYNLPSGHIDENETPENAAIREILEETGLNVEIEKLFGIYYFDDNPNGAGINIVYKCRIIGGKLTETSEAKDLKFFSTNNLPRFEEIAGGGHNKAIDDWKQKNAKNISLLENQLSNVIATRSSQDQILWSIIGVFGATNAILLVALFPNGDLPKSPIIGAIICIVGLLVSFTWTLMQRRALAHIKYIECIRENLERDINIESKYAMSPNMNIELKMKYLLIKPMARHVLRSFGWGMIILWVVGLIVFISIKMMCS